MLMNKPMLLLTISLAAIMTVTVAPGALAYQHAGDAATTVPINDEFSLQKTEIAFSIPDDNALPWASVSGIKSNHVSDYPVILQFYKGDEPVHFAQVDTNADGSYEYKFRVMSLDSATGETVNIFEGDYAVKIFKVVPNTDSDVPIATTI